jgi:hypothetical protein
MTSRQAKKAHQLATRGPRVSRAEQRRKEAEELARQRREYEREKAAAKAKAAREKKAAKEQAERDARHKMGIPEPSKFVRASQPTISRFVKCGNKRTWLEIENVAEEPDATNLCDDEEHDREPRHKAMKATTGQLEDEYGAFPSFSESDLGLSLDKVDNSTRSERKQAGGTACGRVAHLEQPEPQLAEFLPAEKSRDDLPWEIWEDLDDIPATQLLSEAADAAARSPQQEELPITQTIPIKPPRTNTAVKSRPIASKTNPSPGLQKQIIATRSILQERSDNIPPPPLPIQTKHQKARFSMPLPPEPQTLPRPPRQTLSKHFLRPSATQVLLEDNLEDFFPSPTQEIRELLDDIDDLPSNTQIAQELEPQLPSVKAPIEDLFASFICTQDFILSSQDMLEIKTPCQPASKPKYAELPMSTPKPLPSKPATGQPRRRFFVEKDEDLLHAAIQESKTLAAHQEKRVAERSSFGNVQETEAVTAERDERDIPRIMNKPFQRTPSNLTDYGEDEFHECEEELLALY